MERAFIRGLLLGVGHFVGFLSSAFFMAFLIGEGLPDFFKSGVPRQLRLFIPMLILAVVGYLTSIFKRTAGSLIMLAAGTLMFLFHIFSAGDVLMAVVYGLPYILSGLALYLAETRYGNDSDFQSDIR